MPRRVKTKKQMGDEHQRVVSQLRLVRSYSGPSSDGGKYEAELAAMRRTLEWAMGIRNDPPSAEWRK